MPTVHRGYFSVSGSATTGFDLRHRSADFAEMESEDILLSELALPFPLARRPVYPIAMKSMAKSAPVVDLQVQLSICKQLNTFYSTSLFELPLVEPSTFQHAVWSHLFGVRLSIPQCSNGTV